jgi:hypothetical protein
MVIDNCDGWVPSEDGTRLVTTDFGLHAFVENALQLYVNLHAPGKLRISFSKDTRLLNGKSNGKFLIHVNGTVLSDSNVEFDSWK